MSICTVTPVYRQRNVGRQTVTNNYHTYIICGRNGNNRAVYLLINEQDQIVCKIIPSNGVTRNILKKVVSGTEDRWRYIQFHGT